MSLLGIIKTSSPSEKGRIAVPGKTPGAEGDSQDGQQSPPHQANITPSLLLAVTSRLESSLVQGELLHCDLMPGKLRDTQPVKKEITMPDPRSVICQDSMHQ